MFQNEEGAAVGLPGDLNVRVMGSDVSLNAVRAAISNIELAGIDGYRYTRTEPVDYQLHEDPLQFCYHLPKAIPLLASPQREQTELVESSEHAVLPASDSLRRGTLDFPFLSLYHGDF